MSNWSTPITNEQAARRAGGRRAYNAQRQLDALVRRSAVEKAWCEMALAEGPMTRGLQARLAERFGVSATTICRDLAFVQEGWARVACPTCGVEKELWEWRLLALLGKVKVIES